MGNDNDDDEDKIGNIMVEVVIWTIGLIVALWLVNILIWLFKLAQGAGRG